MSQFRPPSQPGQSWQEQQYVQWQQPSAYPPQQPFPEQQQNTGYYPQSPQQLGYQQPGFYQMLTPQLSPQTPIPPQQQPSVQPHLQPKRKHIGRNSGIGGIVGLIVFIAILIGSHSTPSSNTNSTTATTTPQATTQATNQPTSQPTSPVSQIGAPITAETWIVTLNTVASNAGDGQFNIPKAGDVYLVVNVTLKNIASSAQTASSLVMFTLRDTQGTTYNEDITQGNGAEGDVGPGQLDRGDIFYEVPKSVHQFILQFEPSLGSSTLVQ